MANVQITRVVRRTAVPVLLALVAAGVSDVPAHAAPTWVTPAATIAQAANLPEGSQLVADGQGNVTALWVQDNGSDDHVLASTHHVGGSWSAPVDISAVGDIPDEIDLATNATGYTVAVWTQSNGEHDILHAATRSPGSGWSAPVLVGDSPIVSEAPQVAVDAAGNVVVTWLADPPGTLRSATKPLGGPWSDADDVSDPGAAVGDYDLAVTPGGQATAAWKFYATIDDVVIQAAVRPPGGTFGEPETISADGEKPHFPQVGLNAAGVSTVAWEQETDDGLLREVKAATREADGMWSAAEDVSVPGGSQGAPDVVVDGAGTSTAVWPRVDNGQPGKLLTSTRPAGGTWAEPEEITAGANAYRETVLAIDASYRIAAAYLVYENSGISVAASTRAPGEPWAESTPLSPALAFNSFPSPRVAMDDAGQSTVTWIRPDATPGYVVETRSLDTQGPLATGLSIPGATVGQPVTLQWPAVDAWSPVSSIAWSFGDGGSGSGASVTRTFGDVGSYDVTVTATDSVGNATTLTGTVVVSPAPPAPAAPAAPAAPVTHPVKPSLSGVKLTKRTIHVAGSEEKPLASKLKLTINTDAKVIVKLKRAERVKGKVVRAKLTSALKAGKRAITVTSKVSGRKLPPGTYTITVKAENSVGSSAGQTVKLRIKK